MSKRIGYLLAGDSILLCFSYYLAFFLKTGSPGLGGLRPLFLTTLPLAVPALILCFALAGIFHDEEELLSIDRLKGIISGVCAGVILLVAIIFLLMPGAGFPRSVFAIFALVACFAAAFTRISWRLLARISGRAKEQVRKRRVLVVGAGRWGDELVREMLKNPGAGLDPVHIVDEAAGRQGRRLHGVRIQGKISDIPSLAWVRKVDEIAVTLPTADGEEIGRVAMKSRRMGLPCRTLPEVQEIDEKRPLLSQLRPVWLGDLVDRGSAEVSVERIRAFLSGKKVLVTGAGGMVGAELCRQAARFSLSGLFFFDADGERLNTLDMEMERRFPSLQRKVFLGDITSSCRVREVMEEVRPEVVFHTTGRSEVWMLQNNFREAFHIHVSGSRNAAEAAAAVEAGTFIHLSSSEAFRPANYLGLSMRIAERVVRAVAGIKSHTRFASVRLGELLSEDGGLYPVWQSQIDYGGPLTVPHVEATRYFSTVQRSVKLLLQAAATAGGGEVFFVFPGRKMKMADLARLAVTLSGAEPDRDVAVTFSGLKPGERLSQVLPDKGDGLRPTGQKEIFAFPPEEVSSELLSDVADMEELIKVCDGPREILMLAKEMVPDYRPLGRKRV